MRKREVKGGKVAKTYLRELRGRKFFWETVMKTDLVGTNLHFFSTPLFSTFDNAFGEYRPAPSLFVERILATKQLIFDFASSQAQEILKAVRNTLIIVTNYETIPEDRLKHFTIQRHGHISRTTAPKTRRERLFSGGNP